jgi:hypothetical protein
VAEGRNHAVGNDRPLIFRHAVKRVVADRSLKIGGVEVDQLMGAFGWDEGKRPFSKITMRIEEGNTAAHGKVLAYEIEDRR